MEKENRSVALIHLRVAEKLSKCGYEKNGKHYLLPVIDATDPNYNQVVNGVYGAMEKNWAVTATVNTEVNTNLCTIVTISIDR